MNMKQLDNKIISALTAHYCPKCGDKLQIAVIDKKELIYDCLRCQESFTVYLPQN